MRWVKTRRVVDEELHDKPSLSVEYGNPMPILDSKAAMVSGILVVCYRWCNDNLKPITR